VLPDRFLDGTKRTVLWVRISFNADSDPSVTRKVNFLMKNIFNERNISRYKSLFEKIGIQAYLLKFWSISLRLDPDPHSQYGSGSRRKST
jgi:hypothetical protein